MSPIVTLAETKDLADVVRLLGAQLSEHDIPATESGMGKAVLGMLEMPSRGHIWLARIDGKAVGLAVISYTWTLEHGGLSCWLDELYVDPTVRSKGIGKDLLQSAIEVARSRGCAAVDLEVVEGHERAAKLYERHGFKRHNRVRWVLPL